MTAAGNLRERLTFQRRALTSDGYGNSAGDWQSEFTCAAELRPRMGGETVLQERLAGRQPYTVTIRYSAEAAEVTPEWRAFDARNPSRIFNIRSGSNPDMKRRFIELLVDENVAT